MHVQKTLGVRCGLVSGAWLLLALAAPGQAPANGSLDFEALAADYRRQRPVEQPAQAAAKPRKSWEKPADFDPILDQHFVHGRLGLVSVDWPRAALPDKQAMAELREVALGLIDVQLVWMRWLAYDEPGVRAVRSDAELVRKSLARARLKLPKGGSEGLPADLLELFGLKSKVRDAAARWAQAMHSGAALGFVPSGGPAPRLVLIPERREFVELACFLGSIDERNRSIYWTPGLGGWTELWWHDLQVIALEYPGLYFGADPLGKGIAMDSREETGMLQHVVQRAAVGLSWTSFGMGLDAAFELGLAQVLVVDVYGENNTRSGGGGRGGSVGARSAFVPGGNPNGGALPPANLDSTWRGTLGKDYFAGPLHEAQAAGSKEAPPGEGHLWFRVLSERGSPRYVRAPFLGSPAAGKELPPEEFLSDYLEFFRAYRTAFVQWLRTRAGRKEKESAALFAELLRRIGDREDDQGFEEVVGEVYGRPLSAATGEIDNLEQRFLTWLARG